LPALQIRANLSAVQTCVGCGKNAPETDTNYTLISAQFGWRLTRVKRTDGSVALEWRCPTCWRDYKRARGGVTAVDAANEMPANEPPSSSGVGSRPAETAVRQRPGAVPARAAHEGRDAREAGEQSEQSEPAPAGASPRRPGRSSR
jgi:hypothetical protein